MSGLQVSCDAYRGVVRKDPRFIDYFQQATPVAELGRINIGSRPSKRKAAGSIDDLRAIPWIFAWTQTRFHLPVWLGIGEAFQASAIARIAKGVGDNELSLHSNHSCIYRTCQILS